MCICDTAENKIPEGSAGIIETKMGFLWHFTLKTINQKIQRFQ